jgi:hypothetical protein
MKKLKSVLAVLAGLSLILVLAACSAAGPAVAPSQGSGNAVKNVPPAVTATSGAISRPGMPPYPAPTITVAPAPAPVAGSDSATQYSGEAASASTDRMVVRTGNLQLVVGDVPSSLDLVVKMAGELAGFVVNSQKWKEGERTIGTIAIRVPAASYDKAVALLRAMALDVITENSSSQDVTQEYVDQDARLRNLQATEAQLLKIMQTATKTQDILDIQRELTNVRGQIEQTKGRMQYLERTSSTSLINIRLEQASLAVNITANKVRVDADEKIQFMGDVSGGFAPYNYEWSFGDGEISNLKAPLHAYGAAGTYTVTLKVNDNKGYSNSLTRYDYVNVVGGWAPGNAVKNAWSGFVAFGKVFVDVIIWLVIFSPVWIIVGGIIWWRIIRKRKKAQA